jgi:hypothetical protein
MEPDDALRMIRKVGLGLLLASLFVDWAARELADWRIRVASYQYRVVPDVGRPGAILADLAIELLDATSPRSQVSG